MCETRRAFLSDGEVSEANVRVIFQNLDSQYMKAAIRASECSKW